MRQKSRPHKVRTCRDFVKTLCREGQEDYQVLAVTSNTRWNTQRNEVKGFLERRGDRWRKMGDRWPPDPDQVKRSRKNLKISTLRI